MKTPVVNTNKLLEEVKNQDLKIWKNMNKKNKLAKVL